MAYATNQSIGDLIARYDFKYNSPEDLSCSICRRLMIDPCQSYCGCQFCYKCIAEYVWNRSQYCPGKNNSCKDEHLELDKNIFRSAMLNTKITKLKVTCPNGSCGCITALTDMAEHLRLCVRSPMECPYAAIGCQSKREIREKIESHLRSDSIVHSELLMQLLQSMKNDIDDLRKSSDKSNLEMVTLKEELFKAINGRGVRSKVEEEGMNKTVNEQRREIESLTTAVNDLKNEMKCKENRIVTLEGRLRHVTDEMEVKVKRETKEINKYIDKQRRDSEDARMEIEKTMDNLSGYIKYREKRLNRWVRWNKLCPNIDVDFVWRIDQCSKKGQRPEYSESFYSNNYKLRLCVNIDSSNNIALLCAIMKSENDDKVQWPMKRSVTLAIVDQYTWKPHNTKTYKYDTYEDRNAFDRPTFTTNGSYIGSSSFIKYSSIKNKESIIANDSLIVSCLLSDS